MRIAKILVSGLCFFQALGLNAQDIVVKLKPQYKTYINNTVISDKKLKSLFNSLQVSDVQEIIRKGVKPAIADGIVTVRLKDKAFAKQIGEMLNHSGFFQYVEVLNSKTNLPLHIPSDPFAEPVTGSQYYLEKVNAYKAWDISKGDTNMTICIVDNGADFTHPEFLNKIQINKKDPVDGIDNDNDGFVDNFRGWDFANNDNFPEDSTGARGHGSEVSGIAAASTNNGLGIASMGYHCRFLPYKIFGDQGVSSYTQYSAVAYAAQQGCKVINMSWGNYGNANDIFQYEQDLLNYAALDKDAVLVGATFPKEGTYFTFPGDYENVLSVLSLFSDDTKSIPQATHYWIDMSVPGLNMISTTLNGNYGSYTGISVGLPLVSGAAALARIKYPNMNSLQIQELLRVTARNIDTVKTNIDYKEKLGHGCLDAFKVLTDTITPAIRIKEYELKRFRNDTISLQLGFKNFLWKSKNLKMTFRAISGGFTVLDSIASAGAVKMLDSSLTVFGDIKLKILPFTKENNVELVRIGIEDSANNYIDYQYFYVDKNFESIVTSLPQASDLSDKKNIYPNPCTDNLIVETSDVEQVSLIDFAGRTIHKEIPISDFTNINMVKFTPGIYFLQIKSGENISRTKIVKK